MIVLDGATGTELARHGVDTRTALFSAQALASERGIAALREVHRDYAAAGASSGVADQPALASTSPMCG